MNNLALLATALQSDYFLILNLLHGDEELDFLIPKPMYSMFIKSAEILNIEVDCLESTEPACFILQFKSAQDKEALEDEMNLFNQQLRKPSSIPMPNIYEGGDKISPEVCRDYLQNIAGFFESDFKGNICIPVGVDVSSGKRNYCVFNGDGLVGIFDESQIQ